MKSLESQNNSHFYDPRRVCRPGGTVAGNFVRTPPIGEYRGNKQIVSVIGQDAGLSYRRSPKTWLTVCPACRAPDLCALAGCAWDAGAEA